MSEDQATSNVRTPWHLWAVGIFAFLWSGMGAFDYLMTQTRNEAYMANFTEAQLEYFYGFPAWVEGTWALAVWGALAGSVFLLAMHAVVHTGGSVPSILFGVPGTARASFGMYNTKDEVDVFIDALQKARDMF